MRHLVPLRWLLGYLLVQVATLPLALPCWNRFLRDSLGQVLTGEQLHVLEYAGLGALAAWSAHACGRWRVVVSLVGLVIGAGMLDEGLQVLLPQRVFEWSDVFLNWTGALLGWGIGGILARRVSRHARGGRLLDGKNASEPRRLMLR